MKIGDEIWRYDWSARVGEKYRKYYVVAETPRSWIVSNRPERNEWAEIKLPKNKPLDRDKWLATDQEKDEHIWAFKNRSRIASHLLHGNESAAVLRQVAELIGYKEEK